MHVSHRTWAGTERLCLGYPEVRVILSLVLLSTRCSEKLSTTLNNCQDLYTWQPKLVDGLNERGDRDFFIDASCIVLFESVGSL